MLTVEMFVIVFNLDVVFLKISPDCFEFGVKLWLLIGKTSFLGFRICDIFGKLNSIFH